MEYGGAGDAVRREASQACVRSFHTALLSLLACAVWDRRNLDKHDSVTLRFGLGVFAIAFGGVSRERVRRESQSSTTFFSGELRLYVCLFRFSTPGAA